MRVAVRRRGGAARLPGACRRFRRPRRRDRDTPAVAQRRAGRGSAGPRGTARSRWPGSGSRHAAQHCRRGCPSYPAPLPGPADSGLQAHPLCRVRRRSERDGGPRVTVQLAVLERLPARDGIADGPLARHVQLQRPAQTCRQPQRGEPSLRCDHDHRHGDSASAVRGQRAQAQLELERLRRARCARGPAWG